MCWIYPAMDLVYLQGSLYCYTAFRRGVRQMRANGRTFMRRLIIAQRYVRRWVFVRQCKRGLEQWEAQLGLDRMQL